MWMEEAKDSAIAKRFVEIAGRERLAEQERRGIARSFVSLAEERHCNPEPGMVDELVLYGDEAGLMSLIRNSDDLFVGGDVREFVRSHGIDLLKNEPQPSRQW